MKRFLSLLVALAMVLGLTSSFALAEAQTDDPAFKKFAEPVEVHIGMSVSPTNTTLEDGDTVDNNFYTRYLLDNYNIKVIVDWTAANGTDYDQKVALTIASNSMPDAMVVNNRSYFLAAAESDMLYDLGAAFEQYASQQVKQIYATTDGKADEMVTYDGKISALANISVAADGVHVMMVQQNWLDQLGLEVPTTIDELYEVAKAIKEAAPAGDRTIPILGAQKDSRVYANFLNSTNNQCGFEPIFTAMDAYPGYFVDDGTGKVVYGTLTQETRDALELLAKWYQEGLIDPEFATRDYYSDVINANECAFFAGPWWSIGYGNGDSFKNDSDVNWQAYPLFTKDGKWNSKMKSVGGSYTLVNKNVSEDVAAAIIIMNNVLVRYESSFTNMTAEDIEWYPIRNVMGALDECEYTYEQLIKILDGETAPEDYKDELNYKLLYNYALAVKNCVPGYEKGKRIDRSAFNTADEGNFQRQYSLLVGDRPYATTPIDKEVYSVTYATNETIDRYWSNLEALEDSMVRSIITGKSDITAFDAFVEQWMNEGGSKVLEAVQAEYDAAK